MEYSQDLELTSFGGDLHSLQSYVLCIKHMLGTDKPTACINETLQNHGRWSVRVFTASPLGKLHSKQNKHKYNTPATCFGQAGPSSERTCQTLSRNYLTSN